MVLEARRRSDEFVANARTQTADRPSDKEDTEAADRRVINDPGLQATSLQPARACLYSSQAGGSEEHRPGDFLPVPNWQRPP
jgi:hypothetical protein